MLSFKNQNRIFQDVFTRFNRFNQLHQLNRFFSRNFKTYKKYNIDKLIKKKKIKNHELYNIKDVEILLNENQHDVLKEYPTVPNVHQIIDVKYIPVFRKAETPNNILNKISLHFGDFTYIRGDAVVNGTNTFFSLSKQGSGYDCSSNFLKSCGTKLFEDIENSQENKTKEIIVTEGYNSCYKCIIHVIEPYYNETEKLQKCYENVLLTAKKHNLKNVVFPLLGSGISLFKKQDVVLCALQGICEFFKRKENFLFFDKIVLCTITDSYWMLLKELMPLYLDIYVEK